MHTHTRSIALQDHRRSYDYPTDRTREVYGVPGRIRLSRNISGPLVPGSPVRAETVTQPSTPNSQDNTGTPRKKISKFALWADRKREDIQAYEYLCRVGEAKAWIESVMGVEDGMEITEWEEKMRDGVALAKLVKQWGAPGKVFEHPRLQWRHSDNVNMFLNYVRGVGLPENFVFEFTDLYEKKNMPKVIYCIHALSYLLARWGIAHHIGSLLGTLEFSDDQLAATQKGLKAAGVAMPNFGDVGKELWKEMKEEPMETEEDRIERELLEQEPKIVLFQTIARGFMARQRCAEILSRLDRLEPSTIAIQALCHGWLTRCRITKHRRNVKAAEGKFVIALQSQARGVLARARRKQYKRDLARPSTLKVITGLQSRVRGAIARNRVLELSKKMDHVEPAVVWAQTVLRGVIVRRKIREQLGKLDAIEPSIIRLQAVARGALVRRRRRMQEEQQAKPQVVRSIVSLQACARGLLKRRKAAEMSKEIGAVIPSMVGLQSQIRGGMVRQRLRAQLARLDSHELAVVRFQAVARGYLARKEYRSMATSLRKAMPLFVGLQARTRAMLAKKRAQDVEKALANVQVVQAVSSLQAFARAALTRKRHQEQAKQLEFVAPDVLGLQAQCRGVLARRAFGWWWHYVHEHQAEATNLQALCRGIIVRRRFMEKINYYRANLSKVVKIQSLFRAKEQREQYRQLTMGQNVTVSTIKNFVHLLNDSEFDFEDEIEVERLRKKVIEAIRENQHLETYVTELDVKIALVVQTVKSVEELVKARRWGSIDSSGAHTSRAAVLAAHGDPFAGPSTLDIATKRKLELYQQLFYLLQTKGEYLARLFFRMSRVEMPEKTKRTVERVTLILFGYGQRREEYLMLKLFQHAISEEVRSAPTISDIVDSHPMFLSIALQYVRPKQVTWLRETLRTLVEEVVGQPAFNLETDPIVIYRAVINAEEMRSGVSSGKPVDATFEEAAFDPHTRGEWIRHLQMLRHYTEQFLNAITNSTRKMPYNIRSIARDLLASLKTKFPGQSDRVYATAVGKFVYYRFIHPAMVAPDAFDIVPNTIGAAARRNLGEVARMLTQISSGSAFLENVPSLIPLNAFVNTAITQTQKWVIDVAELQNPEEHFKAHELLDATEQPSSIVISPNEVYAIHSLLAQNLDHLTTGYDDTMRVIITELDGVPHLGSDELRDARDRPVTLELTNRFADVKDPNAGEKALWVHAKRGVLAVLRVQPAKDLMTSLMAPVTDEQDAIWEEIIAQELPSEEERSKKSRLPATTTTDPAYRLEDIRTQSYRDIKAQAMFYLLELEKLGKLTRTNGFQGVLNAIAGDVRSKHMKRMQRKNELESMEEALRHLVERKKAFEDQINSYHSYIDSAMNTMQRGKGKKRFVMPFTKQYFHLRDLHKAGKNPQFGSYKYSAQELYDKGILLSIDKFSPRQFDRIDLVISSDQVGDFTVEMFNNTYGTSAMSSTTLRMEDLLQSQFENRVSLSLFDGLAKVNLNLLLYQINKKFYV
ncbi:hypothetical protein DACRYDRAFT_119220 [Dacryopinax primogenitus]|uniref:Ras GTPase-activating protein n=1 Tax=Dacryopinax primogenitus (strain DJM 731) TaxID=1858805 RepID=M5FRD4_DACPD|nr:uncharacterized protein DACRYDRAFT_119220 [Dacryopinax primogenitus]EJT97529.1 hypothetical protein DACRYDRAFT_119220 [Dacryopinax primogenitus]